MLVFLDQANPGLKVPVVSLAILDNAMTLGKCAVADARLQARRQMFTVNVSLRLSVICRVDLLRQQQHPRPEAQEVQSTRADKCSAAE